MTVGLDTSIVLRLLTGEPAPLATASWTFVSQQRSPVTVCDLVVAEAYHALQQHYRISASDAASALRHLLSDPRIMSSGVAGQVLGALPATLSRSDAGLMDRFIHAAYAAEGTSAATIDRGMAKLQGTIRVP
jgi:predicted nucleic acid-binding protein